jgi:hypothetical protein
VITGEGTSGFPGPETTLGGFVLRTFLLLILFVIMGASVFSATRTGADIVDSLRRD